MSSYGIWLSAAGMKVLAHATAFLQYHVVGDARFRGFLVAPHDGVAVRHAK